MRLLKVSLVTPVRDHIDPLPSSLEVKVEVWGVMEDFTTLPPLSLGKTITKSGAGTYDNHYSSSLELMV